MLEYKEGLLIFNLRTNGRVVATGSLDMFSNELYELSNFENRKYA